MSTATATQRTLRSHGSSSMFFSTGIPTSKPEQTQTCGVTERCTDIPSNTCRHTNKHQDTETVTEMQDFHTAAQTYWNTQTLWIYLFIIKSYTKYIIRYRKKVKNCIQSQQAVRQTATICLRPCKLTISLYLFTKWHLFRHVGYVRHQQQVDLWPFDLESDVRVTCDVGYL